jgi:hypothetical protein
MFGNFPKFVGKREAGNGIPAGMNGGGKFGNDCSKSNSRAVKREMLK